ncbi:DNA polymerase III subunit chi [Chiayiivirga flava]|uniref:DNA polymerase-3 subunit chi n=1 Tax=Chiayiivirga flava TaxID=659595 RepID=A0A7W8D8E8_9GAMM|nr:DNA polymerase III subunit chi [Chiayiivirga flava]MBB5208680.1 DNA polymerase-3 subunit chi [Chiayiivirga flava]
MPRADFYLIAKPRFADDPLLLVCELARKAYETGQPVLILARDAMQAEALDERLWDFDEDAYLPHQIAGQQEDDDDEITPIVIASPEFDVPDRPLVINLRDAPFRGTCERVLEVVPADPSAREPLRARWRDYQARGFELKKIDM